MDTKIFSKKDLTDEALKKLSSFFKQSKVIAFPTETVYGIGAHIFREDAIEKIYALKKRSKNKALIAHLGKIEDVKKVATDISDDFYTLANFFFPGPLTIVLKKNVKVPSSVSRDSTIAVRMPSNIYTQKLINLVGVPIVGTSANISNEKSPFDVKDVIETFSGKIDAIIDTGICEIKIPSTIISLVEYPYKILRQGFITKTQINNVLKISEEFSKK